VSYAGFTDTIVIDGTVTTGTVDLNIKGIVGTWVYKTEGHGMVVNIGPQDPDGSDPEPPMDMVELVAFVNATVDLEDPDMVTVTWDNLFPLEENGDFIFAMMLCYEGSIPARINALDVEVTSGGDWIEELIDKGYITYGMFYGMVNQSIERIPVEVCDQLHDGDCFMLFVDADIEQNNSYQGLSGSATFSLEVIQWNEADCIDIIEIEP